MLGNSWNKKEMPLVSLIGMGGGIASPAFLASIVLNILKPTVFSPADDTGVPDFVYEAASSAIANVGQVTSDVPSAGSPEVFESAATTRVSATFDSTNNKVVVAYRDSGNSDYGTAIVGTVSGNSITFGTPAIFESAAISWVSATYDSTNGKVVVAYEDQGNSGYGTAVVGTVSGTSISFGTPVVFEYASTAHIGTTFDSTNGKVVIAYNDQGNSQYGTAVVGTVSGTSISFGSPAIFESAMTYYTTATYDSTNNKVVIAYADTGNSYYGTVVVGTVSGTSISFGSAVVFESATTTNISSVYDSSNQKVVIAYQDSGNSYYGTAVVGTVSGTSISFGTPVLFDSDRTTYISATYDSTNNKVVIAYQDSGNSNYGTVVVGTVSGTSISFDSSSVFQSAETAYISSTFDSTNNKVVMAYADVGNSYHGTAVVFSPTTEATQLTLTDTTVSKVSDGTLISGTTIDEVLTVGETVQNDTATASGTISASSGNTITLSNTSGTWSTGMKVQGVTTDTKDNPDPILAENVSLTSSAPTAERNVNTWGDAVWELATDENFTQNVQTATTALSATGTQAGPSFTLEANTGYYTRTKYTALGQESEWSDVTYFVTGSLPVYADDVFSTTLYSGNSSNRTITNGIDLAGQGGLVWIKKRSGADNNEVFDTARGAGYRIRTDSTAAQSPFGSTYLNAFNSDGFTVGTDGGVNQSGYTYASWTFRKAPGFFDVVTYTGNGANRTIAHNLGSVPGFIMVKRTDAAGPWVCFHRSLGNTKNIELQSTNGEDTNSAIWNNTDPTSTNFTVGTNANVNGSGRTFVAYLFAHDDQSFGTNGDESIIKCGSYTGNGSSSGPVVNLGWEPQWLLIKGANASVDAPWFLYDNMRGIATNGNDAMLSADDSDAEFAGQDRYDLTSTGFRPTTNALNVNESGKTYIYMAIRRPHKPPTVATDVFATQDGRAASDGSTNTYTSGFPVDLIMRHTKASDNTRTVVFDRLRGEQYLLTHANVDEAPGDFILFDSMTGVRRSAVGANTGVFAHMFRRAPGFMDVVAYEGTGSATTINHNLGVAPEMMWIKNRIDAESWSVYHKDKGADKNMWLNDSGAGITNDRFNNTAPTASVFSVKTDNAVNSSGDTYIAYLFATLDGISKVGSYTGTGSDLNVDCGFTAGARFVLIKRTDSTGDWYVWDTERGIVSGNDPYLTLNTTDAEVTNTDYIDPLNAGFTVTSSAPAALNASGGTYIFLAIA